MPFKPHPTDPDKMVYVSRSYELDPRHALRDEYERGFVDGMQHQMQSSVDKAVNGMTRPWVGLTWEEVDECFKITPDQYLPAQIYKRIEAKLKEKNHG